MKFLIEMAYERNDAIERCANLGKQFIEHFKKVVDGGVNDDDFGHHCNEMQVWYNDVKNIVLKYNKKKITNSQLIDWFFTIGSSVEYILDDKYVDFYEDFIIILLNNGSVASSFYEMGL